LSRGVRAEEGAIPCRCPTLVETAPTIDFIGDGQKPIEVTSNWAGDPRPLSVWLRYGVAYSDEKVIEITERFIRAGFETDSRLDLPLRDPVLFTEDDWEVVIGGVTRDGIDRIRVVVHIVEPDRDAAETLAPLMDALGTVP